MFYNCFELVSLTFNPKKTNNEINMAKMFYNCEALQSITLDNKEGYFIPNDMSSMFYNCNSLTSLDLNKFKTHQVEYINYMLYNCINLENFLT
jgi:surface protein